MVVGFPRPRQVYGGVLRFSFAQMVNAGFPETERKQLSTNPIKSNEQMKRKRILATLLLLAGLGIPRVMAQTLVLHHADGTTTDVELYTQPQVVF